METVLTLISSILGCTTLVGFILYGKANRRIKNAEAIKAQADANEAQDHRFDNLLKLVDSLTARLSTLNATVDKHIDRNRELSNRLFDAEQGRNVDKDEITRLADFGCAGFLVLFLEVVYPRAEL